MFLAFLASLVIAGLAFATTTDQQVRVLNEGDCWQVECLPGDNAYQIEYLDGDMFVTVEAQFLNATQEVVHTTTHTLVQHTRMSAKRIFASSTIADGAKATSVRFECGSGRARVFFGSAKALPTN